MASCEDGLGNITWKCRFEILSRYQRKREAGTKRGLLMALAIFNYINFPAMRTAARGNFISGVFAMTLAGCSSPYVVYFRSLDMLVFAKILSL